MHHQSKPKFMTRYFTFIVSPFLLLGLLLMTGCDTEPPNPIEFEWADEVNLGEEIHSAILSNADKFPILNKGQYEEAYAYIDGLMDDFMATGKVIHSHDTHWEVTLIESDDILGGFTTPGGFIYLTTGLLKSLEHEDEFAAILAHEITYSDKSYATQLLEMLHGVNLLIDVSLGSNEEMALNLAQKLNSVPHTQSSVEGADKFAVNMLCDLQYDATALLDVLARMEGMPDNQWLLTRPSFEERTSLIEASLEQLACTEEPYTDTYTEFINLLP